MTPILESEFSRTIFCESCTVLFKQTRIREKQGFFLLLKILTRNVEVYTTSTTTVPSANGANVERQVP
ncbi:hypothetical protein RB195_004098 [Necator americanus]|uniref:Uncharacterized protein n=1 Tax=Necator americanus TaxID=51031 RepID=A0ABR1BJW0_NECAM